MTKQKRVHEEIEAERQRQDGLWGVQNWHQKEWLAILAEEFGEVARAANDGDEANYRVELIQVAAVAVAMVESLQRNGWQ